MNKVFICLGILLALAAASCNPITPRQNTSQNPWLIRWLRSPACQPPCWEGITPGITTFTDAIASVQRVPNTQITYRINSRLEWTMDKADGGWITTDNGKVASIRLFLNSSEVLTLGQLEGLYGQPSAVGLNSCEGSYCEIDLTFPSHKMVVQLLVVHDPSVPYRVSVLANSTLGRISFYQDMETYSASPPQIGVTTLPWRGYGDYP